MEGVILALTTPSECLKTVEVEKVPASPLLIMQCVCQYAGCNECVC